MITFCLPGHILGLKWEFPCLTCLSGKSQLGEEPGAFQHSQGFRRHPSACSASSALSWGHHPQDKVRFSTIAHHGLALTYLSGLVPPHAAPHPGAAVALAFHAFAHPRIFAQAIPTALKVLAPVNSWASPIPHLISLPWASLCRAVPAEVKGPFYTPR